MLKILNFIGLAKKAGKIKAGTDACIDAMKKNGIHLLIIANDTSDSSKKKLIDKSTYYNVKYLIFANKYELGNAIGFDEVAVLGITDSNFATSFIEKYSVIGS